VYAERLPLIVWRLVRLCGVFILASLIFDMSHGVSTTLVAFNGSAFDYFVVAVALGLFLVMFISECSMVTSLAEEIGVTSFLKRRKLFLANQKLGGCGMVFIAIYASFALLMLRMAVGPELFFRRLNAAAKIGAVPNKMVADLVTISARGSILNLRHFIYDNSNCRLAVKQILRGAFS
jgi:hypothetical protein